MQIFFVVFLIFVVKFEDVISSNQYCTRNLASFTRIFEKCHPNDYCLALDSDRPHRKLFSTKTAYQTKKSHDEPRNFHVEGNKLQLKYFYRKLNKHTMILQKDVHLQRFGY